MGSTIALTIRSVDRSFDLFAYPTCSDGILWGQAVFPGRLPDEDGIAFTSMLEDMIGCLLMKAIAVPQPTKTCLDRIDLALRPRVQTTTKELFPTMDESP